MSHNLSPNIGTQPDFIAVVVPDPGDNRTAASVVTPLQALYNIVWYIWALLGGGLEKNFVLVGQAVGTALTVVGKAVVTATLNVATDLAVGGKATITGAAAVGGNLVVNGALQASSAQSSFFTMLTAGTQRYLGPGRPVRAAVTVGAGVADVEMNPATATTYYFNHQTSVRQATIDGSVGIEGDELEAVTDQLNDGAGEEVRFGTGSWLVSLRYAAGYPMAARAKKISGNWRLVSVSVLRDP